MSSEAFRDALAEAVVKSERFDTLKTYLDMMMDLVHDGRPVKLENTLHPSDQAVSFLLSAKLLAQDDRGRIVLTPEGERLYRQYRPVPPVSKP
jgi:hypothetical protein